MRGGLDTQALLRLMAWLSPAFPIGGFAWSGGLERAVHDGLVRTADDLSDWLATLMSHGGLWNDAVLFREAFGQFGNGAGLREASELGLALGRAFVTAASAWPAGVFELLPADVPFPVAVGSVAAAHGVPAEKALAAYLHAAVSQSVSAAIRLGVCGQSEGVAVIARLEAQIGEVAERASGSTLDDLGSAAVQADIASLRHERQHSRLFRS